MDTATLLVHRPYWSNEATPHTEPLPGLTDAEAEVYAALCGDTCGLRVRLEQEFVRFDLVTSVLTSQSATPGRLGLVPRPLDGHWMAVDTDHITA